MTDRARRIVLTGVSRGLGLAMAEGFIAAGHVVAGCARSEQAIEELRTRYGSPHRFDSVDVARDADVGRWAKAVVEAAGPPDLLINNAGIINRNASLWKVPAEEFDRVVDVNLRGVANVLRHFLPAMVERGRGVVVNFSSYWGREAAAEVAPYCATKFAVEGLTSALAKEFPSGMAAVAFNPGIIDTEMLRACFGDAAATYSEPRDWAKRTVPFLLALGPDDNGGSLTAPGQ